MATSGVFTSAFVMAGAVAILGGLVVLVFVKPITTTVAAATAALHSPP